MSTKSRSKILRIFNFLPLFLLAVITGAWIWEHRNDGKLLKEIDVLLAQGEQEELLCEAYKATPTGVKVNDPKAPGIETYATRNDALVALARLEQYPGLSPGFAAVKDFMDDREAEVARNFHKIEIIKRRGRINTYCDLVGTYTSLETLLRDANRLKFSTLDKERLVKVVETFLVGEPKFRNLMEGMIKVVVLKKYLESLPQNSLGQQLLPSAKKLQKYSEEKKSELTELLWASRWDLLYIKQSEFEAQKVAEIYRMYYPLARAAFSLRNAGS